MAVFSAERKVVKTERVPLVRAEVVRDIQLAVIAGRTAGNPLRQGYFPVDDSEVAETLLRFLVGEPGNSFENADQSMTGQRLAGLEAGVRRLRELLD